MYADRLRVDIGLFALLGKKIVVDEILLENAYVNLYTIDDSATFNFAFIPEAFADTTQKDTTEAGWDFDLKDVVLADLRFAYEDYTTAMKMGLEVNSFLVKLKTLGLNDNHIQAKTIDIDGLNFDFFQLATQTPSEDTLVVNDTTATGPLNPSGFKFSINDFIVKNSNVSFVTDSVATPGKINFGNLALQQLSIDIQDIDIGEDAVLADIKKVAFLETNSAFALTDLAVKLGLEMPSLKAQLTSLVTNNSALNGQIEVSLSDINQTDSLLNLLFLDAALDSMRIGIKDASFFSTALDSLPALKEMVLNLTGQIRMDQGNAIVDNFQLKAGDEAILEANALVRGLDDFEKAYLNVDVKSFVSNFDFLATLLPPNTLPASLEQSGSISLNARAEGYLSDADLIANITSNIGRVNAHVNYKAQNENDFKIDGEVNAYRLDLKAITGNDSIGMATINTNFTANSNNGSFSADTLALTIKSLQFNDYTYQDLKLNGSFKDSLLIAQLWYDDNNLKLDINTKASLEERDSWLVIDGAIPKADLLKLRLSPDSIIVQTAIKSDFRNLDPDKINGYFLLDNTVLIDGARKYTLDTFQIKANTEDTIRRFVINSDFVDATLEGNFEFASLPAIINDFTAHYFSSLPDTTNFSGNQYFILNVDIKDEPMLVKVFMPDLSLPEPSTLKATYRARDHFMKVDMDIPVIAYQNYYIQALGIAADTKNDNIKFAVTADQISLGENMTIPDFGFEGSFIQDMMQFNLYLANSEAPSYLDFNGFLTNSQDTIILEILESSLAIEKEEWVIPNDGIIKYANNFLLINNFLFEQGNQLISLQTHDEYSENAQLDLEIKAFEVGDLFTILDMQDYQVKGQLEGKANITNVFALDRVVADFNIDQLVINDQEAGTLTIKAEKSPDDAPIQAAVSMVGAQNDFSLDGTYNLEDSINTLAMKLAINKFKLDQWGVFVEEYISDLQGNIKANIDITGSIAAPVVEGFLAFAPESQLRVNAIGSLYRFDDQRIDISQSSIDFNNFIIKDSADHQLSIKGKVNHQYFQDFNLDLTVNTEEFKFFQAKQRYSPTFYGTINAATNITIQGPIENLVIKGSVTTKKGTKPVIALVDDPDVASHASFINFVNTNAYLAADSIPDTTQMANRKVELTGITINLVLNVTPDAEAEILIDPVSGDKLIAVGEGDIMVQMAPTGDMNIQGTYVLSQGSYSLSFMNIIKKEFQIREGSTINLAGDPLGARFAITAVYSTEASASNLYPGEASGATEGATASQVNVKQPVNVVLKLNGTLESPDVAFGIELPAITDPNNAIAQRIKMIQDDQTQLYQQVFGLIVLNRFIPTDGGLGSSDGGGGAAMINQRVDASVSSILTAQLSRLTQDYLGGVELSVDMASRNQNETSFENKDVQVQLSKQLFNERLTITVGGTSSLGGQPDTPGGGSTSGLMGDFEILYRINEAGTLNLRIFQSNTRDIFTQEIRERQGTSLTYVKSFDEIFVSKENKKVLRAE